jgi:hypothetical protein
VIVSKIQESDTMLRAQFVRGLGAAILGATFVAAPIGAVRAVAPQDSSSDPASQNLTPEQRMNRRYPQPVRVGYLVGLPMLDPHSSTLGYIRDVARSPDGKIVLVVPYRAWLGWAPTDWGRKTVAVPLETVAIIGRQVATLDFSRDDFAAAPHYTPQGAPLPPDETIRIAVARK